jgi:hypothetical protein
VVAFTGKAVIEGPASLDGDAGPCCLYGGTQRRWSLAPRGAPIS